MLRQPDEKLIPSLNEWDAGTTWYSWLASNADFECAIAYSQIFWPQFIEHKNGVFIAFKFKKELFDEWKIKINDLQEIEKLFNHEHVLEIFGNPGVVASVEQLDYIADLLSETWRCKLKNDYPDKSFKIEYIRGTPETLMDYQITFYQQPPSEETGSHPRN